MKNAPIINAHFLGDKSIQIYKDVGPNQIKMDLIQKNDPEYNKYVAIVEGELFEERRKYPTQPTKFHEWDVVTEKWVDPRTPAEAQEQARAVITAERDQLLAASDWTQMLDSPLSPEKRADWAKYRQELRDITLQPDYSNIIWPKKPE